MHIESNIFLKNYACYQENIAHIFIEPFLKEAVCMVKDRIMHII